MYVFEVIIAKVLTIHAFSIWSTIQFFIKILPYTHLGVLSAYNKHYPILLGQNKKAEAFNFQKQVNEFLNLINFTLFSLILILAIIFLVFKNSNLFLITLLFSFIAVLFNFFVYAQSKCRNNNDYNSYSLGIIIFSFSQLIILLLLIRNYNLFGVLISVFSAYLITFIFYYYRNILCFNLRFKFYSLLLRFGFYPYATTLSFFVFQYSDRLAFITLNDPRLLSGYSFCFIFMQFCLIITGTIGKLLGPLCLFNHGQGDSSSSLLYMKFVIRVLSIVFVIIFFLHHFFSEKFILYFFNKYIYVIDSLGYYLIISYIFSICQVYVVYFICISKELLLIFCTLFYSFTNFMGITILNYFYKYKSLFIYSKYSLFINLFCLLTILFFLYKHVELNSRKYLRESFSLIIFCLLLVTILI